MAIFALAAGLVARSRSSNITAALMVLGVVAVTFLAAHYGDEGYDRVLAMSNGDAQRWLELHAQMADKAVYAYGAAGVLALLSLIAHWKKWRRATTLSIITLALSIASFVAGGRVSRAGGQVRHSEFRSGPP